jgi:hypothetical protein
MAQTRFTGPVKSDNGFIGDITGNVTGNVSGTITGAVNQPAATVAAAGTNQATAASVAAGFTRVTGADGAKGVKLPAAVAGATVMIVNGAAQPLLVYPNTSDKINGGTADTAVTMENSSTMIAVALDATDWYTLVFTADA